MRLLSVQESFLQRSCTFVFAGSEEKSHMNITREQLLLYAITDRSWLKGETLYEQVEKALKGGVT